MTAIRLSQLQKRILTTLYEKGGLSRKEIASSADAPTIIKLESEGYKCHEICTDPQTGKLTGKIIYAKPIPGKIMSRSMLISYVHSWDDFGFYRLTDTKIQWSNTHVRPPQWNTKQAAFTRSLQSLSANKFVELLSAFFKPVVPYGSKYAERLERKPFRIAEEKQKLYGNEREQWEVMKNTFGMDMPFDKYLDTKHPLVVRGVDTGRYRSNREKIEALLKWQRNRNTQYVKLAELGENKAKELLNVKS